MSSNDFKNEYDLREHYCGLCNILYSYHGAGGSCHIVTDDGNLRDSDIHFCVDVIMGENRLKDPVWLKHVQYALLNMLLEFPEGSSERNYTATGMHERYDEDE